MKKEPLYKVIYLDLKNAILNQHYSYGTQVPTEMELTETYQVSRITAKRALMELESDRLIERTAGKGSFVIYQSQSLPQTYELAFMLPFSQAAGLEYYVQGATDYLEKTPYQLTIHATEGSPTRQRELLQNLKEDKYDGLIIYPENPINSIDLLYRQHLNGFPIVMLDKKLEGTDIPSITSDNFNGGALAANYALKMGHTKIAYLSTIDLLENTSVRDRYLGYLKALHDAKIQDYSDGLTNKKFIKQLDAASLQEYLLEIKRTGFTCIIAENDIIAMRLLAEAKKLKLDIPNDLSLIGFDNIQMTDLVSPQLTTVEQNFYQIGFLAAESLVQQLTERDNTNQKFSKIVPVALVERESVQKQTL